MRFLKINSHALALLMSGIVFFYSLQSFAEAELDLMPYPHQLIVQADKIGLDDNFYLVLDKDASPLLKAEVKRFIARLNKQTGLKINTTVHRKVQKKSAATYLRIDIAESDKPKNIERLITDESYQLQVLPDYIRLRANNRTGAIRGLETLLQ